MEKGELELKSPSVHIIREIYENDNALEHFVSELDKALIEKVDYIIIEPNKLADETARWILVGNCLSKTSIVCSLACLTAGYIWPKNIFISSSFCAVSVFCSGLYTLSWNSDPCVEYQVEGNPKNLKKITELKEQMKDFSSPVFLVYKSNKTSKYLQQILCGIAIGYCGYRLYETLK